MKLIKLIIAATLVFITVSCDDTEFKDTGEKFQDALLSNTWYEAYGIYDRYRVHKFTKNSYQIVSYASKEYSEAVDTKNITILDFDVENSKFNAMYDGKAITCSYYVAEDGKFLNIGCEPNVDNELSCFGAWNSKFLAISNDVH